MNVASMEVTRSSAALFAGASVFAGRVITPLNNCALSNDASLPQFFCVHSLSGAAGTDFLGLAERVDPKIRFYGIQAPPKAMPNVDFGASVESIAAYYADALVEFQPEGTLFIGGYCIGAVIALAMANNLIARGRQVGPLVAIDGVPENTSFALRRWMPRYWFEFLHNVYLWGTHPRLVRSRTMPSVFQSIVNNMAAICKELLGMNRAQRFGGGYSVESYIDISRYQPEHLAFINRLFNAIFEYEASRYSGDVIVYEAVVKPPLRLPQIGRIWKNLASRVKVVEIVGTHYHMMREPYVDALASDLTQRISEMTREARGTTSVNWLPGTDSNRRPTD